MSTLAGRVAIVTGASSGIGEVTARRLASLGVKVALAARRVERLEALAQEITDAGGEALVVATDVAKRADVEALVTATYDAWGRVDVLINNAGVMLLSYLKNAHVDEWDRMIDINIKGPLYGIAAVLPIMRSQGHGHVINVSSMAGRRVLPSATVYCATKFALHAISLGMRQELTSSDNIRVTIIAPGIVATELTDHITDGDVQHMIDRVKKIEPLTSEDIAASIVYALEQPDHVNVLEVAVMPTRQQ